MKTIITFLVVMLCSISIHSQPLTSLEIDKLVEQTMSTFDVPGIGVAILKDGEIVHMKGYGVRSLDTGIPLDENTLFGIASNSKAFTAYALGLLQQEGKLDLDDRVIDYIPEFRLYDPYVTNDFRIRDLLCHRSGMGLGAGDLMIWPDGTDFSREDMIHNLRFLKQVSPFRTKYDYDNLLFIVAGEVVAKASGTSWEEFVETRIMKPLKMSKSACSYKRLNDVSNVIDPHAMVDGKVQVISRTTNELMNAAGGIYSSVYDMSKWATFLLEKSDQPIVKELWSQHTIIPVRNPGHYNTHFAAYGLGFRLADEKGYKVISHTGGLAGIVTKMTLIPELNLAIIVFTNQQVGAAFSAITNKIKDGYFGISGVNWIDRYATAVRGGSENAKKIVNKVYALIDENTAKGLTVMSGALGKSIIGDYADPWLGAVHIKENDGQLRFIADRSPNLDGEVFWYKGNTYVVKWKKRSMDADAFVLFEQDYEGHPAGFKMKAISPLTDFSFDFHDLDFTKLK